MEKRSKNAFTSLIVFTPFIPFIAFIVNGYQRFSNAIYSTNKANNKAINGKYKCYKCYQLKRIKISWLSNLKDTFLIFHPSWLVAGLQV